MGQEPTSRHVGVMSGYSPQSGHSSAQFARPLCAISGQDCKLAVCGLGVRVGRTHLAIQIVLGMKMIIVTTVIQSGFTVAGVRALRRRVSKELTRSLWRSTLILALFVLWLFLATTDLPISLREMRKDV